MAAPVLQAEGAANANTTGSLTVTLPAHQTDDILVLCMTYWGPNTAADALDIPTPSGWTSIGQINIGTTPDIDGKLAWFWIRATSSSMTNPVCARGASWDTGTDTCFGGRAYTIRNCVNTGTPWDEADVTAAYTTADQLFDAVTVVSIQRSVIQFGNSTDNQTFEMTSSGWTTGTADPDTSGTDCGFQTARKVDISASTAADTPTVSAPNQGAYAFCGISFIPHVQTITPTPVAAVSSPVAPVFTKGVVDRAPSPVAVVSSVVAPVFAVGAVDRAPTPTAAVSSVVAPVFHSTIDRAPVPVAAVSSVVIPVFENGGGGQNFNASPLVAVSSVVAPVFLSTIDRAPSPVAAVSSVVAPAFAVGAVDRAPSPVAAVSSVVAPVFAVGAVDRSPAPVTVASSTVAPVFTAGVVDRSPSPVTVVSSTVTPTFAVGVVNRSPVPVVTVSSVATPIFTNGFTFNASPVAAVSSTVTPAFTVGVVNRSPSPTAAASSVVAPVFIPGAVNRAPSPATVTTSVLTPTYTNGGIAKKVHPRMIGPVDQVFSARLSQELTKISCRFIESTSQVFDQATVGVE